MRFSDACPDCTQPVRWHHVIASPVAPFYFRCKHCQARLRLKTGGDVLMMLSIALAVYVAWVLIVLGLTAVAPGMNKLLVLIVTGSIVIIVGVVVIMAVTFKGGMLSARQGGVLADEERGYFTTVVLGLLTLAAVAVVLGFIAGYMTGFLEDMVRQMGR